MQFCADSVFLVEEPGEFADGQAVAHRNWVLPDERGKRRVETISGDSLAANGIGAVEDEKGNARLGAGGHAQAHGVEIGVKARADVLNVKEHQLDAGEHGGIRCAHLAIETVGWYAGAVVGRMGDVLAVLRCTADSVLWPVQGDERTEIGLVQPVGGGL